MAIEYTNIKGDTAGLNDGPRFYSQLAKEEIIRAIDRRIGELNNEITAGEHIGSSYFAGGKKWEEIDSLIKQRNRVAKYLGFHEASSEDLRNLTNE